MQGPPMERAFHVEHFGRWWDNPQMAQQLNITDQQKKQMDDIFLQHRLKLIDLHASLEKAGNAAAADDRSRSAG